MANSTVVFPSGQWAAPATDNATIAAETSKVAWKIRILIDPFRLLSPSTSMYIGHIISGTDASFSGCKIDVAAKKDASGNLFLSAVFGNSGTAVVTPSLNAASIPTAGTWVVMYAHVDRTTPSRVVQLASDNGTVLTDGTHTMLFSDATLAPALGSGGQMFLNDGDLSGATAHTLAVNGYAVYTGTTLSGAARASVPSITDAGLAELNWTSDGSGTTLTAKLGKNLVLSSGAFTWNTPVSLWVQNYLIAASVTTYAETGIAAAVKYGHKVVATVTSYAETGIAAAVTRGRTLVCVKGTFTETGVAATLSPGTRTIVASPGVFVETGKPASLTEAHWLSTTVGGFVESGIAAPLSRGYKITAVAGSFAETGVSATLSQGEHLIAAPVQYSDSYGAANMLRGLRLSAGTGIFVENGKASTGTRQLRLAAVVGAFVETGKPAVVAHGRPLVAATGTFVLTGIAAPLTIPTGFTLPAATGVFTETGVSAAIRQTHQLAPLTGAFAETGRAATLAATRRFSASPGAYLETGIAANLKEGHGISATTGAFAETGRAASLLRQWLLPAVSGSFGENGKAAPLLWTHLLASGTGAYAENGVAAGLVISGNFVLTAPPAAFAETGRTASLLRALKFAAIVGAYTETSPPATLARSLHLAAAAGTFTQVGIAAPTTRTLVAPASPGVFTETGQDALVRYARVVLGVGSYVVTGVTTPILSTHIVDVRVERVKAVPLLTVVRVESEPTLRVTRVKAFTGSLTIPRRLSATVASFSETGVSAALTVGHLIAATAAVFTETGVPATVSRARILPAAVASYTETGVPAVTARGRILPATTASYTESGIAAVTAHGYRVSAAVGAFTETSVSATLALDWQTLIAALGGDTHVLGFYDVRGGVHVTAGVVFQWDDIRGSSGFGPSLVATGTARPAWDATNLLITGDGVTNNLSVASTLWDLSTAKSIGYVGQISGLGAGNHYAVSISDAGFGNSLCLRCIDSGHPPVAGGSPGAVFTASLTPGNQGTTRVTGIATGSGTAMQGQIANKTLLTATRSGSPASGSRNLTVFDYFPGGGSNAANAARVVIVGDHVWSTAEIAAIVAWTTAAHAVTPQ